MSVFYTFVFIVVLWFILTVLSLYLFSSYLMYVFKSEGGVTVGDEASGRRTSYSFRKLPVAKKRGLDSVHWGFILTLTWCLTALPHRMVILLLFSSFPSGQQLLHSWVCWSTRYSNGQVLEEKCKSKTNISFEFCLNITFFFGFILCDFVF